MLFLVRLCLCIALFGASVIAQVPSFPIISLGDSLGEGGMGVVYKAEDTQLRRTVALKFLPRETLDEEDLKARLIREAQATASLDHPNICPAYEIAEDESARLPDNGWGKVGPPIGSKPGCLRMFAIAPRAIR